MARRSISLVLAAVLLTAVSASPMAATGPAREGDSYTVRFFDDFILELCGIETLTTLTERWTLNAYADGTATFHGVRTFVPDDVRIPIERGAGTSHIAADGSRFVTGSPTRLIDRQGGGVRLIDAGRAALDAGDNLLWVHGKAPSFSAELVDAYCP